MLFYSKNIKYILKMPMYSYGNRNFTFICILLLFTAPMLTEYTFQKLFTELKNLYPIKRYTNLK